MGEVDEVTPAHLRRARRRPRRAAERAGPWAPRPRRRDQDARADRADARAPACVVGRDPRAAARRGARRASPPASSTRIAEDNIRVRGGVPSFLGYGHPPFPGDDLRLGQRRGRARHPRRPGAAPTATSSRSTAARSSTAGTATPRSRSRSARCRAEVLELMRVTEEAMWRGIAAARLGGRVTDISHAVESLRAAAQGDYGILEDYVGHGIGTAMHLPPNVPNFGRPGRGPKLVAGLALAVEPMITLGSKDTDVLEDDWTVVTDDGILGRALRAHLHADPRRRLGAHRARRRRGGSPSSASPSAAPEPGRRRWPRSRRVGADGPRSRRSARWPPGRDESRCRA